MVAGTVYPLTQVDATHHQFQLNPADYAGKGTTQFSTYIANPDGSATPGFTLTIT